ncbi:hypothetical protein KPL70_014265 [Citrus sinensis]|nr:hypothetical protein KPL70_014265 [Citrus sinensis]
MLVQVFAIYEDIVKINNNKLAASSQSYQESFPPLERHTDPQTKVVSQPYVQSPITTFGAPEAPKQYEVVLNWQTQNASAQNQALHHLGKKIEKVASQDTNTIPTIIQIPKQIQKQELLQLMPLEWLTNYQQFHQNSEPVQTSQAVFERRADRQVKLSFQTPDKPSPDPPRLSYTAMITVIDTHNNDSDSTSEESLPSTDNFSSSERTSSNSESQYADISGLLMATKTEDPSTSTPVVDTPIAEESSNDNDNVQGSQTEPAPSVPPVSEKSSKPSSSPWFTFDDIPRHKWQTRHQEFAAWIDVQMTSPNAQSQSVLREFCSRFTGSLRDCSSERTSSDSESQYADISGLLMATKIEDPSTSTPVVDTPIAEESFDDNDNVQGSQTEPAPSIPPVSEKSSKPSSSPWFTFDDIPRHKWQTRHQEFAAWIDVQMTSPNTQSQSVLREFCSSFTGSLGDWFETCKKPYLKIQCKDDKKCTCPTTKMKHFQKHFHRSSSKKPKKPYRYFRKKDPSQFRKKKHNHCFICKRRRHSARNCPNKSAKTVRLIQHLQQSSILSDNEEVESIFSEQSEKDDHTTFILADSIDSDPDGIYVICTIQEINHIRPTLPGPSVKISVIPSKFHKPVSVIGFLDTGAQRNMLNPKILPLDYWEHHTEYFRAANGKIFETSLITKKPIDTTPPYTSISQKFLELCPENHSQFTYPFPLWKNEQFFIHLPFKLNEDVNPTKATHPVHTSQLSRMLKKMALPWGPAQTEAVKQLKKIAQSPPLLKIPTTGQRILQTDASDDFWSAILLEKIGDSKSYCAHASGQFKVSEKNYHVIYKEILAVKYGIKKFEFHLISHNFLIRMDNSSFPKIFDFKNKLLPDKQLLNLKTWFAR